MRNALPIVLAIVAGRAWPSVDWCGGSETEKVGSEDGMGWKGGWAEVVSRVSCPPALPALLDKQHFPIRRQRPALVRDHELEGVARLAQFGHRGHDGVPEMLGVLLRGSVAVVVERVRELVGCLAELVDEFRDLCEGLASLNSLSAGRFHRRDPVGHPLLV